MCEREAVDPCPHLPEAADDLTAAWMEPFRGRKDGAYYRAALQYGQSLWLQRKPAQAILQLNKAWAADPGVVVEEWPPPYAALLWMLRHVPDGAFLGNPVRHFQHLATRVSGDRVEARSGRAWACFHLSRALLEQEEFPEDRQQIEREGLELPSWEEAAGMLAIHGWDGEEEAFLKAHAEAVNC